MHHFDQDIERLLELQNFIASLGDDIVCPLDLQAIRRVLLLVARRIDVLSGGQCERCPYPRVARTSELAPA